MATFSQDLSKLEELERRYHEQLPAYESELVAYQTLLQRDPHDPQLADRYRKVEERNQQLQQTYSELASLRQSLAPQAGLRRM